MYTKFSIALLMGGLLFLSACEQDYTPKPRGYMRMALPEKSYQTFEQKAYPYSFDYPVYAKIKEVKEEGQKYWMDVVFEGLNANLHLSYSHLKTDTSLSKLIEGAIWYKDRHLGKASGVGEWEVARPADKVWGTIYDIKGTEVASTYQFFLTDSTRHFVRGALYFECTPNNDSLEPAIEFLKADINRLVESLKWQ